MQVPLPDISICDSKLTEKLLNKKTTPYALKWNLGQVNQKLSVIIQYVLNYF